jgi:hypothetical protein
MKEDQGGLLRAGMQLREERILAVAPPPLAVKIQ